MGDGPSEAPRVACIIIGRVGLHNALKHARWHGYSEEVLDAVLRLHCGIWMHVQVSKKRGESAIELAEVYAALHDGFIDFHCKHVHPVIIDVAESVWLAANQPQGEARES